MRSYQWLHRHICSRQIHLSGAFKLDVPRQQPLSVVTARIKYAEVTASPERGSVESAWMKKLLPAPSHKVADPNAGGNSRL